MNVSTLEEYKRQLLAEHKAEIAAIDRLIARERTQSSSNGAVAPTITARSRRRASLSAMVSAALKSQTEDFDKDVIFHSIQSQYPSFTGTPSNVARELWKRARAGELHTVQEGRGRIPAVYAKK